MQREPFTHLGAFRMFWLGIFYLNFLKPLFFEDEKTGLNFEKDSSKEFFN